MIKGKLLKGLLLPFLIGVICSVVSAVLLYRYVQEVKESQQLTHVESTAVRVPVVVSTLPLNAGMRIDSEYLRVRELDEVSLPSDVIHPTDAELLIGEIVRADLQTPIAAGKPIQWLHLQADAKLGFADTLTQGMVPFSMSITSLQQHAGLLQPGDVLDLYAGIHGNANLILERVEVLATGNVTKAEFQLQNRSQKPVQPSQQTSVAERNRARKHDYQQITLAVPLDKYFMLRQLADSQGLWPILRKANDSSRLSKLKGAAEVEIIIPGQFTTLQGLRSREFQ
ncbi:Flp pilus assembly protein CpaB [Aliidiomarina shirensis]|uniref:Flp pilus assembly protein CpaB n=1 Tax=Aliidiomarina shirensis TaxID=1048642 RepID=A0A432WY57_9GAMM|nr:Flp pilus assembly protein CpaB [Aliidiomarina shirensis]RUO38686.1 Flp pilus assembly protein CpaB [Aliidiomarina shirensis]